jgi:hypothetical protein
MSSGDRNVVGSCVSSDEYSSNAKASLFLASGRGDRRIDSNSFGSVSNRSHNLYSIVANALSGANPASVPLHSGNCRCILNNHPDSPEVQDDVQCLSPLSKYN